MAIKLGMIVLVGACLLPLSAFAADVPVPAAKKATAADIKAFQHSHKLKETGKVDAATKKALAADRAACKLPGQGSTLDFSDPCNSGLLSLVG